MRQLARWHFTAYTSNVNHTTEECNYRNQNSIPSHVQLLSECAFACVRSQSRIQSVQCVMVVSNKSINSFVNHCTVEQPQTFLITSPVWNRRHTITNLIRPLALRIYQYIEESAVISYALNFTACEKLFLLSHQLPFNEWHSICADSIPKGCWRFEGKNITR